MKQSAGYAYARGSGYQHIRTSLSKLMVVIASLSFLVAVIHYTPPPASALTTVPTQMNFQGRLTDSAGNIKPNGNYNMRLKLYTVNSGGASVWSEDRLVSAGQGVSLTNGLFSLQLGSLTPLPASLFAAGPLYLEVELASPATATSVTPAWSEGPMSPRNQLATSAYAYNAETLDGLDSAAFGQLGQNNSFTGNNTFSGTLLANGSGFDLNGNLGIGTTSPSATLDVRGSTTYNPDYSASAVAYSLDSFSGNLVTLGDDEMSSAVGLPFNFTFYNQTYSSIYICSNGFVTFQDGQDCAYSPQAMADSSDPNGLVAGIWTDLSPQNGGTISYGTVGTAPDRTFIIYFDGIYQYGPTTPVTFQIKLNEADSSIRVDTATTTGNTTDVATQGIENQTGQAASYLSGRNLATINLANDAVLFLPPQDAAAVLKVQDSSGSGLLSIFDNGNVGIGTVGLNATLQVTGTSYVNADSTNAFEIQNAGGTQTLLSADTRGRQLTVTGSSSEIPTFVKALGGSDDEEGYSLVQTSDGGYAVAGHIRTFGAGNADVLLTKYDSAGALSWSRTWGGTGQDTAYSVVQTSDGGYAVTGVTQSFGHTSGNVFLVKYDSTGAVTWSRAWGGTGSDYAYSLVQTSDGGYAITGYTGSYGAGSFDMFLLKYDSAGTVSWSKTWGGTSTDGGSSLVQTSDGGYIVTGYAYSYGVGGDMVLVKYDNTGTVVWSRTWGGAQLDKGLSVVQANDGGYAVSGVTRSYGSGNSNVFLLKYDSAGTLSWNYTWGGSGFEEGTSLIQTNDGGYAVSGSTDSFGAGRDDIFLSKYDSSGTLAWSNTWGDINADYGYSLARTNDGGYAVSGSTESFGVGSRDLLLVKYDANGDIGGCGPPMCRVATAATSSPAASTSSPAASTSSPAAATSSPAGSTSSPAVTDTLVVDTYNALKVVGTSIFNGNLTVAAGKSLTVAGGITSTRPASPTEGMIYYDSSTKKLLTYSNGKWQADRSTSTKIVAASNSSQAVKDAADYVANGEDSAGAGIGALDGDQIEINQALTAAAGGKVYLMEGTYTVDASISIPNNTTLAGAGQATVIQLGNFGATSTIMNAITNSDQTTGSGVTIQDMQLDGRKSLNTAGTQKGVYFNGMGGGAALTVRKGARVTNIQAKNFRTYGIHLESSSDNTLADNNLLMNGSHGLVLTSATNNRVTGNSAQSNAFSGFVLSDSSGNTITGNTSQDNISGTSNGFYMESSDSNTFANNIAQNNAYGFYVDFFSSNNTLTGNTARNNTFSGMGFYASSNNNSLTGNTITNNGDTSDNDGIYISGSDSNIIANNHVTDTSATTTNYAIHITSSSSEANYLADNTLGGGSINDLGTGTIYANQLDAQGDLVNKAAGAFEIQGSIPSTVYTEGFNSGPIPSGWTTSGSAGWAADATNKSEGTSSFKSGATGDWQASYLEYNYTASDYEILTFDWKVSSELGYDFLYFCLDTTNCRQISGEMGWATIEAQLTPGAHNFKWYFEKDGGSLGGSDAGWVDNVRVTRPFFKLQSSTGGALLSASGGVLYANAQVSVVSSADTVAVDQTELMTSSYSFTAGAGWTAVSGVGQSATAKHTAGIGDTTPLYVSPNLNIVPGEYYRLDFTITGATAGYIQLRAGSAWLTGSIYGSGSFTINTSLAGALNFLPTASFDGTITSVSLKRYTSQTVAAALVVQGPSENSKLEVRTGDNSVFLGLGAGERNMLGAHDNTAIGAYALQQNTLGNMNTAIGSESMRANIDGGSNVAVGEMSMWSNTVGSENVAVGRTALFANNDGFNNVALGAAAGYWNSSGNDNAAVGSYSLYYNETGNQNVAIGSWALLSNVSGSNNIALGWQALDENVSGSNNMALGVDADVIGGALQNATAIGYNAQVGCSNCMVLGGTGADAVKVGIGSPSPTNTLSVTAFDYATGTATRTNGSATLTGSGTVWTAAMVGDVIVFADGTTNTVAGFTSATSITMGTTFVGTTGSTAYTFYKPGLQVTNTGRIGVGQVTPTYALDVRDFQASTYVARIQNASTANTADGLLIDLGVANASRTNGSQFISFAGNGVIAGKIWGAASAVAYVTTGADYAEYFRADPTDLPHAGELVTLDPERPNGVKRAAGNDTVVGVISTSPGFVGNSALCNVDDEDCDRNYEKYNVLVSLVGQVPLKVTGEVRIGDALGASTAPGVARAVSEGSILGYALTTPENGVVQVLIRPAVLSPTSGSALQGGNGVYTSLSVNGPATVGSLTVTGNARIIGDLIVEGHFIAKGDKPTVGSGVALGATGAAVAVDGVDGAGTVSLMAGAQQPTPGVLAHISFAKAFSGSYKVTLSPTSESATDLRVYTIKTATGFDIITRDAPRAGETYQFDYIVLGVQ